MSMQPPDKGPEPATRLARAGAAWLSLSQRVLCAATPVAWMIWSTVVRDPDFYAAAGLRCILTRTLSFQGVLTFLVASLVVALLLRVGYRRKKQFDWLLASLPGLSFLFGWLGLVSRFPLVIPLFAYVFPGVAILAGVAYIVVEPLRRRMARFTDSRRMCVLTLVLLLAYVSVGALLLATTGFKSGDEGHYLIQTVSLLQDGDLDLANNLGEEFEFTKESFLNFHVSRASRDAEAHSHHPFGLSILMLPGYVLAGTWGATGILILIAVAHGLTLYRVLRRETSVPDLALGVTLAFSLSLPLLVYSVRAYPEVAAGWLYLTVYYLLVRPSRRTSLRYLVAGLCLGFLPWLLIRRYYVPFVVLNVMGLWNIVRTRCYRDILSLLLPQCLLLGALFLINAERFSGSALFSDFEGSGVTGGLASLSGQLVTHLTSYEWLRPRGLFAVFMDKRFGLVWSNLSIVTLVPAAVCVGLTRWRRNGPWLVMVLGLYAVTCANVYAAWTAGTAAHPPRYLVAVLPFLAIPLVQMLNDRPQLIRGGGLQVSLACAGISLVALLSASRRFECPYEAYTSLLPAMRHLADAFPWFTSWFHQGTTDWPQAWLLTSVLLLLSAATYTPIAPRISKGVFCLLLLAGLMITSVTWGG